MPEDQTPNDDQTAPPPEGDGEAKGVQEPVDDDQYQDVLYAALTKIYNDIDNPDGDSSSDDDAEGDDDGDDEKKPARSKKPIDEMSIDEIRTELAKTRGTLKEVVGLSLQEREERAAKDVWDGFLKEASPVEAAIAKSMSFEVEDKEGMQKQVKQVKLVAGTVEKLIGEQVGSRTTGIKQGLKTRYGILSPEPDEEGDVAAQDAKDMKSGDHASIIARRFRGRAS